MASSGEIMIRYIAFSIVLLFLTSLTHAQMGGGGQQQQAATIPDVDKETLLYLIPEKWYPYSKEGEAKNDVFLFPTGQSPKGWRELIQHETFKSTMGATDATQIFDLKTKSLDKACISHDVETIKDSDENGYSMHQWIEHCETAEEKMITIRKAILGKDQLYLASKIWKNEPRNWQDERQEWSQYMNQVYVCDGTSEHGCFPPNGRGRGGGMGGMGR